METKKYIKLKLIEINGNKRKFNFNLFRPKGIFQSISVIIFLLISISSCFFTGCGKKSSGTAQQTGTVMPRPKTKLPEYVPPPPKRKYTYAGAKYRDPLMPAGASYSGSSAPGESTEVMTTEKLATLQLKGIFRDETTGSIAIIADNSGNSYILKKGKIYNTKRKVVQGVAGVVSDKTVTLFSDNTKINLKLKKSKEEKGK